MDIIEHGRRAGCSLHSFASFIRFIHSLHSFASFIRFIHSFIRSLLPYAHTLKVVMQVKVIFASHTPQRSVLLKLRSIL